MKTSAKYFDLAVGPEAR